MAVALLVVLLADSRLNAQSVVDARTGTSAESAASVQRISSAGDRPMLTVVDGRLIIAWRTGADGLGAAIWNPATGDLEQFPDMTIPEGSPAEPQGPPKIERRNRYEHEDEFVAFDGVAGASRIYQRSDQITVGYHQPRAFNYGATGLMHFRPTPTGWRGSEPVRAWGEFVVPWTWYETAAGDPASSAILISVHYTWNTGSSEKKRRVLLLGPDAKLRAEVGNVADTMTRIALVPAGDAAFMVISGSIFERWSFGGRLSFGRLDSADSNARYHALLDRTFLSMASNGTRLQLRCFDTAGRQLRSREIGIDGDPAGIYFLQKRVDSSIALLWSGSDGIHAAFLSPRSLTVVTADTLLLPRQARDRELAGHFLGDTLALAWTEAGQGVFGGFIAIPRMKYDTAVNIRRQDTTTRFEEPPKPLDSIEQVERFESGDPPLASAQIIQGFYPNPSPGEVTIGFDLPFRSDLSAEIWSMQGERVTLFELGHYHTGRGAATVSLKGIGPGIYYLRLVSDFGITTMKLVVAPRP